MRPQRKHGSGIVFGLFGDKFHGSSDKNQKIMVLKLFLVKKVKKKTEAKLSNLARTPKLCRM